MKTCTSPLTSSTVDFDNRLGALLEAWNSYQDLRFDNADVSSLWSSRRRLEAARSMVRA